MTRNGSRKGKPNVCLPMTAQEKVDERRRIRATFKLMPLDYLMTVLNEEPQIPEPPADCTSFQQVTQFAIDYAKHYAATQEVRIQAAIAAAPYLHQKLTAIEHKQDAPFVTEVVFTVIEGVAREKVDEAPKILKFVQ